MLPTSLGTATLLSVTDRAAVLQCTTPWWVCLNLSHWVSVTVWFTEDVDQASWTAKVSEWWEKNVEGHTKKKAELQWPRLGSG